MDEMELDCKRELDCYMMAWVEDCKQGEQDCKKEEICKSVVVVEGRCKDQE